MATMGLKTTHQRQRQSQRHFGSRCQRRKWKLGQLLRPLKPLPKLLLNGCLCRCLAAVASPCPPVKLRHPQHGQENLCGRAGNGSPRMASMPQRCQWRLPGVQRLRRRCCRSLWCRRHCSPRSRPARRPEPSMGNLLLRFALGWATVTHDLAAQQAVGRQQKSPGFQGCSRGIFLAFGVAGKPAGCHFAAAACFAAKTARWAPALTSPLAKRCRSGCCWPPLG